MPRKIEVVRVPETFGRDANKYYLIREKPALASEKWAWRLFLAVKGTSASIPEELTPFGMQIVHIRGINSFLAADVDFNLIEPLLNEMMDCVQIVRDPKRIDPATEKPMGFPMILDEDIEEPATVLWLRSEVLRVHTNFSVIAALSAWVASTMDLMKRLQNQDSSTTPTSPPQ